MREVSAAPLRLVCDLAALRQAERTKLHDRMDEGFHESLKDHLASINKDLATARERLSHYEAQLTRQN